MNTKPNIFTFETKLNQLHAFSVLASSECFLELHDEDQLSCLLGLNELIAHLKSDFYHLRHNKAFNLSNQ